ncbi:MAG: hypothetical protein V4527_05110 [Pseudomonadota bacterium]
MTYDLSKLGWKAFQGLACTVSAEVLKRPVQTFLGSKDGGRDGAFLGTWDADGTTHKSTLQCKFIGKPGATLSLSSLTNELEKVTKLVAQGLAEDYVILTNAGVTGDADQKICAAFQAVGVKTCQVFGGPWIVEQLVTWPHLRMMVPRVYGIGDLSHTITGHAYKQAKAILDSMGSDLSCFVPTEAYRQALSALHKHKFVILLGDPASGKSTIAAILALGALDDGCLGALKINSPDQLNLWHPGECQFLWVDDAFGPNQFDVARMSRWNAELGTLRAAIEGGARVVFTSRNYIWEAAKSHLKSSAFPLFKESQVVVNVHALTADERAQMLYNHVRRVQPRETRKRLKPLLKVISGNNAFLPETARRLGDPIFTKNLELSESRFKRLVEHPVEFLTEVLAQLDDASRAAVALIFLNSETGVPSPIPSSPALDMVSRLLGVQLADVAKAMQHLNDSLTRLISEDDGDHWVFRHPTITDAFAELVADSPELVELYVHGAKLDRLIREVVCGSMKIEQARLRVPPSLYPSLIARLKQLELDEGLKSFLGARCEKVFLEQILEARGDILEWAAKTTGDLTWGSKLLLAALASYKLLPEPIRLRVVYGIEEKSLAWLETDPLRDKIIQQIFTDEEFKEFADKFKSAWLEDIPNLFDHLQQSFSSPNEIALYTGFKENLEYAQKFYGDDSLEEDLSGLYAQIEEHIAQLESEKPEPPESLWQSSMPKGEDVAASAASPDSSTIFDDVDD